MRSVSLRRPPPTRFTSSTPSFRLFLLSGSNHLSSPYISWCRHMKGRGGRNDQEKKRTKVGKGGGGGRRAVGAGGWGSACMVDGAPRAYVCACMYVSQSLSTQTRRHENGTDFNFNTLKKIILKGEKEKKV